ncbi:MAG: hypothetical protein EBT67_10060, partial [Betaproteobacteria bacterium]|nr:hypothetical protein [Betaproteobacteria bacterium]
MTTMLLKAISVNAKNETKESQLGVVSPQGSNSRLSLKAKPGTLYRLVDEKTGEVIKSQILVRKGQKLQAIVDKSVVVELEEFFPTTPLDEQTPVSSMPGYLVDATQESESNTTLGLISPNSPVYTVVDDTTIMWVPGATAANTVDAQAFGIPLISALGVSTPTVVGAALAATTVTVLANSGGSSSGDTKPVAVMPKIKGTVYAGAVKSNGNGDLTVDAFDDQGHKIGTAVANNDGTFSITLTQNYTGVVVLKAYDKNTANTDTPTYQDASLNGPKPVPTLLASFYFPGVDSVANISPLTLTSSIKAGVTLDANGDPAINTTVAKVNEANQAVATIFGITPNNVVTADAKLTDPNSQVNPDNHGVVLNLFEQMESNKGGNAYDIATDLATKISLGSDGKPVLTDNDLKALLNQSGANSIQSAVQTPQAPVVDKTITDLLAALTGNALPSGEVTITGSLKQGEALTANHTLSDTDGMGVVTYQWQSLEANGWKNITGANTANFTLTQEQVGKPVRVLANYTDGKSNVESIASKPSAPVANLNDAPKASGQASLAPVDEDTSSPAGATVLSLFSPTFSDLDGDTLAGVAITANNASTGQGKWQWHDGTTWKDIASSGLSDNAALYLSANTLVRFMPAPDFAGTPGALTVR